ncbi:uncharacterized protein LOC114310295 [Camellia sinensis]|uniref:uncharacterized protein LOC114310295 n=1 Tax=Camellia sinensis TaxID=4442 RepID=UPI001035F952|nr:uncharacterized protein LOC114310295 [Camellia sinensis]
MFSEAWLDKPKLAGVCAKISPESASMLEVEFSEEEIWDVVKECEGNKAPKPGGFNLSCYQSCWNVIKLEVVQMMKEFHLNGKLAKAVNSSFITLIPKKECPIGLIDFRPITLVSSVYKILAKVLSRRLRQVLPMIISEVQYGFLSGRCIFDGILIANEVMDWRKKTKSKEFSPHRGLRQGDPLSPFHFNLVTKGLNSLIERAKDLGTIKGAVVGHRELKLSHLQFADDTIIFCEANWEEIMAIKRILRCFELMSGLKINFHKSKVCGIGIEDDLVKAFAKMLNCLTQKLPLNYLGLPLFFLSLFKIPMGIAKLVDRIQSTFLWGGDEYGLEDTVIWKQVVCSKYGQSGGRWSLLTVESRMLSVMWQDIMSLASPNPSLREFFVSNFNIVIENGLRTKFWLDVWLNDQSLSLVFPRLFSLSVENDDSLFDVFQRKSGGEDWNFSFRRLLFAWEEEELQNLVVYLHRAPSLRTQVGDSCTWLAYSSRAFSIVSMWSRMDSSKGSNLRIAKTIWNNIAPPKVQFMTWLAWRDRMKSVVFIFVTKCNLLVLSLADWMQQMEEMVELLKVRVVLWMKSNCNEVKNTVHDIVANLKQMVVAASIDVVMVAAGSIDVVFAAMVIAVMVDAFWMLFFRRCFAGWSSQLNRGVFCHWLSLKDAWL